MSNTTDTTTSTFLLTPASQFFVDHASVTIAPWMMGTFSDLFLQGVLAAQTTNYFTAGGDHKGLFRRTTWLVIGLTTLCILKSIQNIANIWDLTITNNSDPDAGSVILYSEWKHYSTILTTAIIAVVVQTFFAYRYWKLTERWHICLGIAAGILLSFIAACVIVGSLAHPPSLGDDAYMLTAVLAHTGPLKTWSLVHFITAIIVDAAITTVTGLYLQSQQSRSTKSALETISRFNHFIWQSALPPTLCVIANTVLLKAQNLQYTHIAVNVVLPKLYAISLMYTLNVDQELRAERGKSNTISFPRRTQQGRTDYNVTQPVEILIDTKHDIN